MIALIIAAFAAIIFATPIDRATLVKLLGSYTGDGGTDAGDSIYADMVLAQTDLDAILADTGTSGVVIAADGITSDELAATAVAEITASGALGCANPSSTNANYIAVPAITFDTTGTWSTVASHEIAVVTGCVRVRILAFATTTLTDAGNAATLTLGTEGSAANIIASTDTDDLLATEFWNDATPTALEADATSTTMLDFVVMGGKDIGYTIGTEALTGGVLEFHIWWTPLTVGSTVTVGAGGTL